MSEEPEVTEEQIEMIVDAYVDIMPPEELIRTFLGWMDPKQVIAIANDIERATHEAEEETSV